MFLIFCQTAHLHSLYFLPLQRLNFLSRSHPSSGCDISIPLPLPRRLGGELWAYVREPLCVCVVELVSEWEKERVWVCVSVCAHAHACSLARLFRGCHSVHVTLVGTKQVQAKWIWMELWVNRVHGASQGANIIKIQTSGKRGGGARGREVWVEEREW